MSFDSWQSACRSYLELLKEFWPDMHKLWLAHYRRNYWGGLCNVSNWRYMLEYDIMLRRNALPSKGITPSMKYGNLKEAAGEKVRLFEKAELQGIAFSARFVPPVGMHYKPSQRQPNQPAQAHQQSFQSNQDFQAQPPVPPGPVTPPRLEPQQTRLAIGGPLTLIPVVQSAIVQLSNL
jgi:hypothetical protein